jgi:anthranilate phosphoribosyltransferase
MNLRGAITTIHERRALSRDEARDAITSMLAGDADPIHVAALLSAWAVRGESAEEIAGAADALCESMLPFEHDHADAIDTCGTGGDGLASFNLSTAAAIVAAAAGARVIKHGNRSQSSRCGSADLLEAAGIPLDLPPAESRRALDEIGITFLFAPAYHPALRHAASVRRALGIRTLFNFVGPIVNPGGVRRQLLGVPHRMHVDKIARVLIDLRRESAYVVHGAGGADELTLAGANRAQPVGRAPRVCFDARELGLDEAPVASLAGGDARENMLILSSVLDGEASPVADAVILNTAAALVVAGIARAPSEGVARAREAIASGAARAKLARWIDLARVSRSRSRA